MPLVSYINKTMVVLRLVDLLILTVMLLTISRATGMWWWL